MTDLHAVLLRRQHTLFVPDGSGGRASMRTLPRLRRPLLRDLEQRFAELGYLVAADLREALAGLSEDDLIEVGGGALRVLAVARGGHVAHLPQFRTFPAGTP